MKKIIKRIKKGGKRIIYRDAPVLYIHSPGYIGKGERLGLCVGDSLTMTDRKGTGRKCRIDVLGKSKKGLVHVLFNWVEEDAKFKGKKYIPELEDETNIKVPVIEDRSKT